MTDNIHLLCPSKKRGHWIYKFTDELGLDQHRCTGCGKWAIKVPKYGFILERTNND